MEDTALSTLPPIDVSTNQQSTNKKAENNDSSILFSNTNHQRNLNKSKRSTFHRNNSESLNKKGLPTSNHFLDETVLGMLNRKSNGNLYVNENLQQNCPIRCSPRAQSLCSTEDVNGLMSKLTTHSKNQVMITDKRNTRLSSSTYTLPDHQRRNSKNSTNSQPIKNTYYEDKKLLTRDNNNRHNSCYSMKYTFETENRRARSVFFKTKSDERRNSVQSDHSENITLQTTNFVRKSKLCTDGSDFTKINKNINTKNNNSITSRQENESSSTNKPNYNHYQNLTKKPDSKETLELGIRKVSSVPVICDVNHYDRDRVYAGKDSWSISARKENENEDEKNGANLRIQEWLNGLDEAEHPTDSIIEKTVDGCLQTDTALHVIYGEDDVA